MSSDGGGPELGSGGFFGRSSDYSPRGQFGAWPGCGCGTLIIILGGMLVVCGGFLSMIEGMFR